MKQLFTLLFLFSAIGSWSQTSTLKLSSDVWPPFTNVEGEKSIAIAIVEKALEGIDINPNFINTDFDAVKAGITTGIYDGSPAFWKNEEREQELLFSNPYLENQLILVGRKGANVNVTSFLQLKQSRIGLVEGYAYSDSLTEMNDFQIVYSTSDQDNLEKLFSDKIDYMLVDALLIQYLLKYELNDVSALLEFAKTSLIVKPLHLAIRKDIPNAEKIIEQFDEKIKEMIAHGVYNELLDLDWIRADIDGDGILEIISNGSELGSVTPDLAYNVHASESGSPTHFYINNKYYESWDDVPDEYKVPKSIEVVPEKPIPYGLSIKF